uniref:Reverse transcriptase Ty1/copia-type domain-containing protein n=1 Tax=Tanacetum cinerariifolium TaxID=118510 RepID=A0A6L2NBQ6_TANCI|nr:hypothetical protein [Tanacetum cinerariifolium]
MDESISVLSIIDKLTPSWKDFKHTLKHGKDDLSLVKHGSHLRIEESLRAQDNDKGKGKDVVGPSVNMIKEGKNKNNKQNKGKKRDLKEHGSGSGSGSNKNPKLEFDKSKKFLSSRFSMKDIGEADIILGIKIKRKNKGIVITQSHYIEKILKKFSCKDCSLMSTLMAPVEKLKPNTGKPVDQLEYSRAINCLMYAITSTILDIAYVVGRLSRYPSVLDAYSDASWINHIEDSSSTSGWVFLLREVPFNGIPRSKHASLFYYGI